MCLFVHASQQLLDDDDDDGGDDDELGGLVMSDPVCWCHMSTDGGWCGSRQTAQTGKRGDNLLWSS